MIRAGKVSCRVAVLQQLLTKGNDVIVSDADVVWLKNPFASQASGESNFQLTVDSDVAEDGSQKPCTSVMLVKASEPSRHAASWLPAPASTYYVKASLASPMR